MNLFEQLKNYINIVLLVVILLGLVGNVLSFRVYSNRKLKSNSVTIYFRAISVLNFLMILNVWVEFLTRTVEQFSPRDRFTIVCKLIYFNIYSMGPMTPWILVAISFDRFFNICFPKRFVFYKKRSFRQYVIAIVVGFNLGYYAFMPFESSLEEVRTWDQSSNQTIQATRCVTYYNERTIFWMDIFNSTLVPFTLMFILTLSAMCRVRNSRKRVDSSRTHASSFIQRKRDKKFWKFSMALNLEFLLLNLPVVTYYLLSSYVQIEQELNVVLIYLFSTIFYSFYAVDFYVQFVACEIFRHHFLLMFKLKSDKRVNRLVVEEDSPQNNQPKNTNNNQQPLLVNSEQL